MTHVDMKTVIKKKKQNLFKISKWFTWESQIVRKIVISWFKIQSQNNELWTKSKKNIKYLSYKIPFIWDECVKNIRYHIYKILFIWDKYKMSLLQDTFPNK